MENFQDQSTWLNEDHDLAQFTTSDFLGLGSSQALPRFLEEEEILEEEHVDSTSGIAPSLPLSPPLATRASARHFAPKPQHVNTVAPRIERGAKGDPEENKSASLSSLFLGFSSFVFVWGPQRLPFELCSLLSSPSTRFFPFRRSSRTKNAAQMFRARQRERVDELEGVISELEVKQNKIREQREALLRENEALVERQKFLRAFMQRAVMAAFPPEPKPKNIPIKQDPLSQAEKVC